MDLVQQRGLPQIFWTIAPYDWSYPYSEWLLHEMEKSLRPRIWHAVAETLHVVHSMLELGHHGSTRWHDHILKYRTDQGDVTEIAFVIRLEFQDGTRKSPSQDYHGSGRPHFHVLLFCDDFGKLPMDSAIWASLEVVDEHLAGYVRASQCDQSGDSRREVRTNSVVIFRARVVGAAHKERSGTGDAGIFY